MHMTCIDMDELMVAMADARAARDLIARQLPDGVVQDTPELTLLAGRLNGAFRHLSRAIMEMRLATDDYGRASARVQVVELQVERRR
jgi:hypothetical protein